MKNSKNNLNMYSKNLQNLKLFTMKYLNRYKKITLNNSYQIKYKSQVNNYQHFNKVTLKLNNRKNLWKYYYLLKQIKK